MYKHTSLFECVISYLVIAELFSRGLEENNSAIWSLTKTHN